MEVENIDKIQLSNFYQELCAQGRKALLTQEISIAPFLDDFAQDKRIGLTFIARPSPEVASKFVEVTERLRQVSPKHFYYDIPRFHFTILSLITASEKVQIELELVKRYEQVIKEVLLKFSPFYVAFEGVCATHNSIIAKGFPLDETLEELRDALRHRLLEAGLGEGLEDRYRIQGAHVTLARFKVKEDFSSLIKVLDQLREVFLDQMRVMKTQLVKNDFYMSPDKAQILVELNLLGNSC